MSAFDIIILGLFIVAVFYGYRKGLCKQLGAVGGVIAGIILCRLFGGWLTDALTPAETEATSRYFYTVIAYVLLFLAGYIGVRLIARLIKKLTSALSLSGFDRIAGAVFSVFEWFLFFSFALNIWQAFAPSTDIAVYSKMANRKPARFVMNLAPEVLGAVTSSAIFGTAEKVGEVSREINE